MSSPKMDSLAALERPLDEISEKKFREIIDLLERAREHPAVKRVLDQVRPRLRRVRPPRLPTVRRLFYQPFEDLLTSEHQPDALGRIARSSAASVWEFTVARGDPAQWDAIRKAFDDARNDPAEMQAVGQRLWQWNGALLGQALRDAGADREIRRALLGDRTEFFPEIERIAVLLSAGPAVEMIKDVLPLKPIRALVPDHTIAVREMVQTHADGDPSRAFVLLMAVAARMGVPGELFRQIAQMQLGLSRTDHMALTERFQSVTLAEMGRTALLVEESRGLDPLMRTDSVRDLVLAIAAAQQGFKGDGPAKRDFQRLRAGAERAVVEVVEDANAKVAEAVRVGAGASLDAQVETENNLLALRKCQSFAPSVGLEGKVSETLNRIVGDVRRKSGQLLAGLAGPGLSPAAPGEAAVPAQDQIYWAVRMLELAGNADEADRVRRDGLELLRQQQRGRA